MDTIHLVVVGENRGEARATKELEGYQDGDSKQDKLKEQKQRHRCQKRQRRGWRHCTEGCVHKLAGDLDRWLKGQTVDTEMGQWISKDAQNIARASGVVRSILYQINIQSNPSIVLSGSAFQNKRTLVCVL